MPSVTPATWITFLENLGLLAGVVVLYSQMGQTPLLRRGLRGLVLGAVLGATAVASMSIPVAVLPGIFVDGRGIPLALAGVFAGPLGTVVAVAMAASYRWMLGGVGAPSGIVGIALIGASGCLLAAVLDRLGRKLEYLHLLLLGIVAAVLLHLSMLLLPSLDMALAAVQTVSLPLCLLLIGGVPLLGGLLLQEQRRTQLQEEIKAGQARFQLLSDHATDMISRFSLDLERRYVSPACKRLFGYEPEELLGEMTSARMHPDDVAVIHNTIRLMREDLTQATVEYRFRHKAGHWIWAEATLARVEDPITGEIEVVSVARDVSERRAVEEALREAS